MTYETALAELGATDPMHLVDMDEGDLLSLGMKPLEAKRFVRTAAG
jgi:hypothetical protein